MCCNQLESLERRTLFAAVPAGFVDDVFVAGLTAPTAMDFAPDGRLFVCEKGGALRVIKDGQLLPTPFVSLDVDTAGERGLLGVAFDPNFAVDQFVYLYHTVPGPTLHNQLSRFTANGDVAMPGSEVDLFDLDPLNPPATNHNGGAIHFGPDGKLYIGVGENANGDNSQSLNTDLGKMLRINADGSIPTDNPFYGNTTGNNRAIWALGLRNPFTFAFQPGTGRMFIDDVGQDTWEEIDDGIAGSNYGWPVTEGPTNDPRFRGPLFAYPHGPNDSTGVAITGGTFYDPPVSPFGASFNGTYFFADLGLGFIHNFNPATNVETPFATGYQNPVDLKVDDQGKLYVLTIGDGAVHRISATSATLPTPTIIRPLAAQHFVAGGRFGFIGVATDAQDGRLRPGALSWDVQFWRDGVEQRSVKTIGGRAIGFYDVPRLGDETGGSVDVFYRIVLTATNSRGQSASTFHDIAPLTGTIHLLSRIGAARMDGLQIGFDGQTVPTPFDFTGVVGSIHAIDAISPQSFNGSTVVPLRFPNHHLVIVLLGQETFVAPFRTSS